ncbi:MAG: PilZ domain-containing protein [Terriglobia bacterium]|jgi:hypothetical protein
MNERRASQRIPMGLPVEIRWKTRAGTPKQATGKTGNISGSGLFIEVPVRLQRTTSLSIKVVLPRGGNQSPLELSCNGRVVRWKREGEAEGLCVVIDEYELHPLSEAEPGGTHLRKRAIRTPGRPGISHKRQSM